MSKEQELPSDSDDDDEDYVPGGVDSEVGSEAESEGEVESGPENEEGNENAKAGKTPKGRKRGKQSLGGRKKSRKTNEGRCEEEEEENGEENEERNKLSEEEEKKKADSLWADFMKDAPIVSKPKAQSTVTNGSQSSTAPSRTVVEEGKAGKSREVEKVKITKLFEFAGEEVRVEKEVPVDSAEARLMSVPSSDSKSDSVASGCAARGRGTGLGLGIRKGGLGGISSVLGQLGKKAKISVLEKSKLDWDSYKKEEKIEEEISTHNKGKGGYLEKQDFLQRADLRQFEIEKQLRTTRRSNR